MNNDKERIKFDVLPPVKIMKIIERDISKLQEINGPFPRLSYTECIELLKKGNLKIYRYLMKIISCISKRQIYVRNWKKIIRICL